MLGVLCLLVNPFVLGDELSRQRLAAAVYTLLQVAAFALVHGSVAVPVLRVEEPLHAVALFGLGLASVLGGLAARRNGYRVAGTAAVVLDVVAYLACHGLEQDFFGAGLLVVAGATLLGVGAITAQRRRRKAEGPGSGREQGYHDGRPQEDGADQAGVE